MTQLKTDLEHRWGSRNVLPIVGEVEVSPEGIIEVESEEQALQLEGLGVGYYIVDGADTTTTTTEPVTTTEEVITTTTTTEEVITTTTTTEAPKVDEKEALVASLEGKTLAQLQEFAKAFPSAEWRALNKTKLTEYLKSKI